MNCKLPSKTRQTISVCRKEVTSKLNALLSVELIESRVTSRQFQYQQTKDYQNLQDYVIQKVERQRKLSQNGFQEMQDHNNSFINQLDILDQLQGLNDHQLSTVSKQDKVHQEFQLFKASQNRQMKSNILKDIVKAKQSFIFDKNQVLKAQRSQRNFETTKQPKIDQKYSRFQQLEKQRELKQKNRRERTKTQDFLLKRQRQRSQITNDVFESTTLIRNMPSYNDLQNYRNSFQTKLSTVNTKMSGFHHPRKTSKYDRSGIEHKFENFNNANRIDPQPLDPVKNRFAKKKYLQEFRKQERDLVWHNIKQPQQNQYLHEKQLISTRKQLNSEGVARNQRRQSLFNRVQNVSKSPEQIKIISGLAALNTGELKDNQILEIKQVFKRSLIMKMKNYIQSQLPDCKQCCLPIKNINENLEFECEVCSNKNNDLRIPLIGLLFQIENFKHSAEQSENPHQTYSNQHSSDAAFSSCGLIVRQIQRQIQRLQQFVEDLKNLKHQMQTIQETKSNLFNEMNNSKQSLLKILKQDCNSPIKKIENQQQSQDFQNKIKEIISQKHIQQIKIWAKIKPGQFSAIPKIEKMLNNQIPYFLRTPTPALMPILQTLTNNFQSLSNLQQKPLQLSISTPVQLPNLTLGNVKFLIDGAYSIPRFQHIKRLSLEFHGKRTYRQLSSLVQKIPDSVQQIVCLKYDHRINSHPSGQNFPLLSKLSAIKSCKKLSIQIINIKDQKGDLQQMSRILSKKKQLKVVLKKSLFSANTNQIQKTQVQDYDRQIVQNQIIRNLNQDDFSIVSNIIKRVGKGVIKLHLELPIKLSKESRQRLFNNLILAGNYKLYDFKMLTEDNQTKKKDGHQQQNEHRVCNSQQILNRMLNRKKLVTFILSKHQMKNTLKTKVMKQAVCGILIGQ